MLWIERQSLAQAYVLCFNRKPLDWDASLSREDLIDVLSSVWKMDDWGARLDAGWSLGRGDHPFDC